jgi:fructuronate reductase
MTRLSHATLDGLPTAVARARRAGPVTTGIVHFGPGAFHRAHQAAYIDTLLDEDPRWGIAAVSLRSAGTTDALKAQDGLYTLAIRDVSPSLRIIAAHNHFLGPDAARETMLLLGDPAVKLVTSTVTEKGYCLAVDGTLDLGHADIVHDLGETAVPRSLIGWLVKGLAARKASDIAPFVPMPCDNLANNGPTLHAALVAFARQQDANLADWIASEVRVPSTMVDSITPASDAALYADVAAELDLTDEAAVQREAFTQWVIQDLNLTDVPDLASVGATLTSDVGGYERAKLRILNGAHSTLAYAGLLRGHVSVDQAMHDPDLSTFIDRLIREDVIPVLPPVPGLDLQDYRTAVLRRFSNPAIVHRLEQIAQDGTQKLPYRLADTIDANRGAGRMPLLAVAAVASWIVFIIQRTRAGTPIADPASEALASAAASGDAAVVIDRLLAENLGLRRTWQEDPALITAILTATNNIKNGHWDKLFTS